MHFIVQYYVRTQFLFLSLFLFPMCCALYICSSFQFVEFDNLYFILKLEMTYLTYVGISPKYSCCMCVVRYNYPLLYMY